MTMMFEVGMKLMLHWLWLAPALLAFAGFLIGLFHHDSQLAGKSLLVFAASVSATRLIGVVDVPFS
jgi:hypothetical protein